MGTGLRRGPATIRGAGAAAKCPTLAGRGMSEAFGEGLPEGVLAAGAPDDGDALA